MLRREYQIKGVLRAVGLYYPFAKCLYTDLTLMNTANQNRSGDWGLTLNYEGDIPPFGTQFSGF